MISFVWVQIDETKVYLIKYKYIYICGKIVPYTLGFRRRNDLGLWRLERLETVDQEERVYPGYYLNTSLNTAPHISEPRVLHLQS